MWTVTILTLFPAIYPGQLELSVVGKALNKEWSLEVYNIRDYAENRHSNVDDKTYGGGAGMVIRPDVLGNAIDQCFITNNKPIYYLSPRGKLFDQQIAREMVQMTSGINIICGRYEGVDERIFKEYNVEEISMGDFVVSSGDVVLPSLIDCCVRMLPGVLKEEALSSESFGLSCGYSCLLEHPHYTRPYEWRTHKVPDVLVSGHHKRIEEWRLQEAQLKTKDLRPDLWKRYTDKKHS
ncbi:tRNA (guanosine(37)-N1)-methyltransferase TrmD [Rickettsiales endosymbiont of Peranema trichophorum]|uniref:tRNA (guanosine(37)-N1)-methyltransferase TrmD n=1 Tax=Rickettsiales endosymbiont of Peranema trichophorum TaxID=2486577 RepID=UPI00102326F6|nr:tRNA (guanosine(37)-N1)-methyltransferase TrmD [Rickettsiales endosymbiont of Peranema trichophorum]RZI47463.1 tRNA (guanosine(37)-N1)-methyltransferase TrmD [Rickettsiales endosymbiont of Peranema trichophorum]